MIHNPPYEYITLEQLNSPEGRRYVCPDNTLVPSVTTILDATSDKGPILDWREAVGIAEADKITAEAAKLGSEIHENMENYMAGKKMTGSFMGKQLATVIVKKGMVKVNEIWAVEGSFYYPGLYAGRSDLVGVHENTPAIMDFKNSRSEKTEDMIENYFMQLCAYAMAHNWMFNTNIRKGVIMMVTRAGKYLEFIIEGEVFDMYMERWLDRLDQYYSLNS